MVLVSFQTMGSFQRSFETKGAFLYVYYYSSQPTELPLVASQWLPWPNNLVGRLGWYRQGLAEVARYRTYIQSRTTAEVPAVLVAAAIANQGNSPQRPFGWDGLERMQTWLGRRFEWQLAAWSWAHARWNNFFEQPSVGIGQIQPEEARRLAYAGDRINLFNDQASIGLMQAKLQNAYTLFATLDLNQTELFALLALSNNDSSDGVSVLNLFQRFNNDLTLMLSYDPTSRIQLARMMTYIDYLHRQDCWALPTGINTDYLWWLVQNARPMP
ncbi:MAG: hypothetical protein KF832_07475 [Caldilineaceae bacterium]|nr:hypothetical protein [Caldilineaceae bacterium]